VKAAPQRAQALAGAVVSAEKGVVMRKGLERVGALRILRKTRA
jgi:hypothetical protein